MFPCPSELAPRNAMGFPRKAAPSFLLLLLRRWSVVEEVNVVEVAVGRGGVRYEVEEARLSTGRLLVPLMVCIREEGGTIGAPYSRSSSDARPAREKNDSMEGSLALFFCSFRIRHRRRQKVKL